MYKLPESLNADIAKFAELAEQYTRKEIDAVQFKAYRVPMGIYEQRKDEVYMSRIRTTAGVIYPEQFLRLIDIAIEAKSNLVHITTRQEVQIQNLPLESVEAVMAKLKDIGLSTKGGGGNTIRNIMVSEFSGIAEETFDATAYAVELTSKLIAEPDSYLLPRKMKLAFASDGRRIDYAAINDIGFVAKIKDGEKGFLVYAGGGAGSKPTVGWVLFDFLPVSQLYVVAGALKKFFSEHGNRKNRNRARLRYVFYRLGEAETLRLMREYFEQAKGVEPRLTLPPAPEERPAFDYTAPALDIDADAFALWSKRYVTPQRQSGYASVLVPFLLGNIPVSDPAWVAHVRTLLSFVGRFGRHTIRFTPAQNVRLRNIPEAALPELYAILKNVLPVASGPLVLNNIVSCTGADTCRLGIGLSKGLASAIREELADSKLDLDRLAHIRIHVTGCPNSCGQPLWADIGFSGRVLRNDRAYPGYQVFLGARRDADPKLAEGYGNINARDIPKYVRRLFEDYLSVEDKFASFTEYVQTRGTTLTLSLIEEYKTVPAFAKDKNYYFDWGSEEIFTVAKRGEAECAAGVFDMIEVDYKIIQSHRAALDAQADPAKRNELLYSIIYSAARMLLVTRGLDPRNRADVFGFFIKEFIDGGFVDGRFREVVQVALENKDFDFDIYKDEILALADAVSALYKTIDDTLQLKAKTPSAAAPAPVPAPAAAAPETAPAVAKVKDLRGVACPMNFVQTKIQLASLQSGDRLEIWLDNGQPVDNVPGSVRAEGHAVLEQTQVDNYWKVVIQKK